MTVKNPRVNVTLTEDILELLNIKAKAEGRSVSSVTKDLIIDALEREEDLYFSAKADAIDLENTKLYTHEEVWRQLV